MESETKELLNETDDDSTFTLMGTKYYVIRKRWGVLALVCLIMILDMFTFSFFSYVNDVTSFYFGIEPAVTDLQATISFIGRLVPVALILLCGEWLSFRTVMILGTALNSIGAILITIGVLVKVYACVVVGSFLTGSATAILMAVSLLVSVNWFPPKERGKASSASWVSRRLSALISNQIATRAIGISGPLATNLNSTTDIEYVENQFKVAYSTVFGCLAILTFLCCLISRIYVTEKPPPVVEELALESENTDEKTPMLGGKPSPSYNFKREMKDVTYILSDGSYAILTWVFGFMLMERPLGDVLISSLVLKEFPLADDQFVSIMFTMGIILATIFSPLTGQILDKFSHPRATFIIITFITTIALTAFSICFQIHSLEGVFVSFLIMWSTRDGVLVCLTHRFSAIAQKETDTIRMKASAPPVASTAITAAISITVIRYLLDNYTSAIAVLFPLPFLILSLLSYIFLWKYLRGSH